MKDIFKKSLTIQTFPIKFLEEDHGKHAYTHDYINDDNDGDNNEYNFVNIVKCIALHRKNNNFITRTK